MAYIPGAAGAYVAGNGKLVNPTPKTNVAQAQKAAAAKLAASGKAYSVPRSTAPSAPTTPRSSGRGSSGGASGGGSSNAQPTSAYQVPVESGFNQDEYRDALIKAKQGAINSEYETNASIVKNNLTKALAALGQEKAALEPLYQRQLTSIAQNQFQSSETAKEIMNQGGWNAGNSGLAVGEQTKISNEANTFRNNALAAKTAAEADINSQMTAEETAANESLGALGRWKSAQLSAAEADALVASTEYGRAIYESDRDFAQTQNQFQESVRQFEVQLAEQRASRTASQKAAIAKASSDGSAQSEYNKYLGALYSSAVTSPSDAYDLLGTALSDSTLPDAVKEDMVAQYNKWGTAWNIKNSASGQNLTNQYDYVDFKQFDFTEMAN